jgi:hypothetical protein
MSADIVVNLAVEDELSEHLLRASLAQTGRPFLIGAVFGRKGNGYLKRMLPAFEFASRGSAHLVMADLDDRPCVPDLIEDWFRCEIAKYATRRHPNLLFRVAVHEAESWVMADREAFASFLGISVHHVPPQPDAVRDPKKQLLDLVRKSRKRELKDDIVPRLGDKRAIGPDYNGRLAEFVHSSWRASRAETASPSFGHAFAALKRFHPVLKTRNGQKKIP